MRSGFDATTGKPLSYRAHVVQSVADILSTPIGSRIKRRDYGCALHDLTDSPANEVTALRVVATIADALDRWEPRIRLHAVTLHAEANGTAIATLDGQLVEQSTPFVHTLVLRGGS